MTDLVLGIDCSTTATKATAWDRYGTLHAESRASLDLQVPAAFHVEQHAEDWWRSCCRALSDLARQIDTSRIVALSITHQRESFALLDAADQPIRPAILWLDERARADVAELRNTIGRDELRRITGKDPDPTPALYALRWLQRCEPVHYARIARVVDVHGYLVHRLSGRHVTSWASADPLGLLDMQHKQWSSRILEIVGLSVDQLQALSPPGRVIARLSPSAARHTGLPSHLPIVAGGGRRPVLWPRREHTQSASRLSIARHGRRIGRI